MKENYQIKRKSYSEEAHSERSFDAVVFLLFKMIPEFESEHIPSLINFFH